MAVMGKALLVVSVAVATVLGAGGVSGAGAVRPAVPPVPRVPGPSVTSPESDLAHHGHISLDADRLGVLLLSENHGPSDVGDATVRLAFSVPLVSGGNLPGGCLWSGDREVLCSTGGLRADGMRRETVLEVRTAGLPHELTVRVATAWSGGATDRNPDNNDHWVLVPATGDPYVF
ncbi:hypothetical protein ACLGI4_11990 [Streptomyces sp. HMX112]|uniref:hypothetical protein n=1 Tax=Streptomyces sp. HMX112 TaxID=3390850 RepID=UPI003A810499